MPALNKEYFDAYCPSGHKRFARILCVKDCVSSDKKPFSNCGIFCAKSDYCRTLKEEVLADIIGLATTIAVVAIQAGVPSPIDILKLISGVMKLIEKFAHPRCDHDAKKFAAEQAALRKSVGEATYKAL